MKFNKFKKSTRFLAITIALLTLALSLPLTAFAADEVEPQYSIIHTPDGGTISVDPNVTKVDEIPNYLFEDPLGSSRAMMERMSTRASQELKGSYTVDEYGDFWIQTPPEAVGTVTWSVSNSFLASVDSSGMVYVNTAGAFFVLADFTDASGSARTFRYDVLIELSNGIFKFKNKANNLYITLPNGNIAVGTQYVQQSAGTDRNSEFKITKVGTGLYTIRSMVANHVGLSKSSSTLINSVVETGPLTDPNNEAYIDTVDLWSIGSNARGYYIYNAMGSAGVYTITPTSNNNNANYTLTYLAANDNCHWTFVSVVANKHGVDIRNSTDTLAVGDAFQFTATMYSSYFNTHGQNGIVWSISYGPSYASIDEESGILTANAVGNVIVTASYVYNSNIIWRANHNVNIIPIANGTYYFSNAEYDKYMQLDNDSTTSTSFELMDYNGTTNQKMTVEYVGNDCYKILSYSNGKALTAPSVLENDITFTNYNEESTNQKWHITQTVDGLFKISPDSNESAYIAAGDGTFVFDERNIELRANNPSNLIDEWLLVRNTDIKCIGIPDEIHGHDHTAVFPFIRDKMIDKGYSTYQELKYMNAETFYSVLTTSKVLVVNCHGEQKKLLFNDSNFTFSMINNLPSGALSNLELVVLMSCETGKGNDNQDNLVNALTNKGAKNVIGFEKEIYCAEANVWICQFVDSWTGGCTIQESISMAEAKVRRDITYPEGEEYSTIPSYYDS